jgi:hypothetical protein
MKLKFLMMIMSSVLISACVVHPPSVEIEPPIKIITPDGQHYDHDNNDNGKGCPPGLRKQGRC